MVTQNPDILYQLLVHLTRELEEVQEHHNRLWWIFRFTPDARAARSRLGRIAQQRECIRQRLSQTTPPATSQQDASWEQLQQELAILDGLNVYLETLHPAPWVDLRRKEHFRECIRQQEQRVTNARTQHQTCFT